MAVTNYYSFGGEIIGEETGGVRRDYLTDALGSVTATVTSAGVVENTYRYKPYGETLAKTGVGGDPKFLWNGKWGYHYGSYNSYIRSRHYTVLTGKFNSKDGLSFLLLKNNPKITQHVLLGDYIYCNSNPISFYDWSGYQKNNNGPHDIVGPPPPGKVEEICSSVPSAAVSGCNVSLGQEYTIICNGKNPGMDICFRKTRPCFREHEKIHRDQNGYCCERAKKCVALRGERLCSLLMEGWMNKNRPYFECLANRRSTLCLFDLCVDEAFNHNECVNECCATWFLHRSERDKNCAQVFDKDGNLITEITPCPFLEDGRPIRNAY